MLWCLLIIALLAPEVLSGEEKPSGQATNQRESFLVENRELPVTTVVRVKSATEKKESIGTPVSWQPLSTIIADGSKVQEGDVLATFVSSEAEYELKSLLYRQKQTEANVESRIRDIDNRNLDMSEQMDQLKDKLAALEAKLARQQSEPTADDLSIVEGRLRIARINLEGAEKDYRKAQDRFARQMISRAELDNAEKDWAQKRAKEEFARLEVEVTQTPPRRDVDIQTTQLDIVTAKLEIDKLQFEIDEQLKISDIQKEAAVVSRGRIKRRIDEQQEYIDKVTVKAPASGFLSINRYDNNEIVPGARMWKNFIFMEIPDLETICFNGVLPEARRAFHEVGDQVKVFVNGRKDRPLTGTIRSISTLSHDLTDKEEAGWNRDQKANGVKVFDVVIALDKNEAWLRPGMFGAATIHAAKSAQGPAVPLRFVREQDGKFFLSVDGIYQEVSGYEMDGWFVLDNPLLCGKTILLSGVFQAEVEALGRKEVDARLSATGEVMPVKSIQIPVGDIGWWPWPKITWLKEEETMVKAGDEVIKLDPESRVKQVQEQEASLIEARSGRDELEKRVELTRRDGDFRLRVAENRRASARLHANYILEVVPPLPVHTARRDVKLAQIALEHQRRKVEREDARPEPILAPAELAKMHRELERCRLKLEQAQLKLQKAEEGATDIEKSRAHLDLERAEDELELARRQANYENLAIRRRYERHKQWVAKLEKRLEHRQKQVDNHTICAPVDGLLCYNKVYSNGKIAKVAVGSTVGPRFNVLSIPDLSAMEMRVEVNEKYYSFVKEGMKVEVRLPSLTEQTLDGEVTGVDLLFSNKGKKDSQIGLYSSHEPLGEVIFRARIRIRQGAVELKPGLLGEVIFPFRR